MKRIASLFAVLLLAVVAGPALAQSGAAPAAPVQYEERVMGDPDAPVTIIEYSSLTCPHCATFHADVLPEVKEQYIDTGKAKLIFRDFPLDPVAAAAALISRCVPEDNYFKFLDVLFSTQDQWAGSRDPLAALQGYARLSGLPGDRLEQCLTDQALFDAIQSVKTQGQQEFGVTGTPTLIVDGTVLRAYTQLPEALAKATN